MERLRKNNGRNFNFFLKAQIPVNPNITITLPLSPYSKSDIVPCVLALTLCHAEVLSAVSL